MRKTLLETGLGLKPKSQKDNYWERSWSTTGACCPVMIEGRGEARSPYAPSLRSNLAGTTSPYTSNS